MVLFKKSYATHPCNSEPFFLYFRKNNKITPECFEDELEQDPSIVEEEWKHGNLWGFGFTYVYRKSLWDVCRFEDMNWGEDYTFIQKTFSLGKTLQHIPDQELL